MSENTQITEEQIAKMAKKAHFKGWLTQQVLSGNTAEEAEASFTNNNDRADKYMAKLAKIRNTISEQAKALAS